MPKKSKSTEPSLSNTDILNLPISKRREYWNNNKIPKDILIPLLEKSKKQNRVSELLGEIYLAIANKVSGMPSWRNYTEDYKEMMVGRALEHLVKYGHNFDTEKTKNDPVNYLIQIVWRGFQQSLKKSKERSKFEGAELKEGLDYDSQEEVL